MQRYETFSKRPNKYSFFFHNRQTSTQQAPDRHLKEFLFPYPFRQKKFTTAFFQNKKCPLPKIIFQPLSVHIKPTFHTSKHLYTTPEKIAFDFQRIIVAHYFSDTCKHNKQTTGTFTTHY